MSEGKDDVTKELLGLVSGRKRQVGGKSRVSELFSSDSSEVPSDDEDVFDDSSPAPAPQKITTTTKAAFRLTANIGEDSDSGFSDGYGPDLMGDEEDRIRLAAMPEIEREAVLYERAQARLAREERRQLEKKMRELEKAASRPVRGPTASMERKRRTLDELKARRDKRQSRNESDSDYHEDDEYMQEDGELNFEGRGDDDFDVEDRYQDTTRSRKGAPAAKDPSCRATPTATELIDADGANAIRLSRDFLAKWVFHPEFDDLARGCLLRLSIGFKGSEQVYRLVEIRKIVKYHRIYKINDVSTNKAAVLKYGKSEKTFRLDVISNSPFKQHEFDRWVETMKEEHQIIPNKRAVEAKCNALAELQSRPISDDIISAMILAKRELGAAPRNLVAERTMLIHQKEEATSKGNLAEVERIDEELAQLVKELDSQNQKSLADNRLEALAELNRRNRKFNVINAREAERKNVQRSEAENRLDPFSRRKCQPTNFNTFFDSGLSDASPNISNSKEGTPALSEIQLPQSLMIEATSPSNASEDSLPQAESSTADSKNADGPVDLFAAHCVDIDIDI